MITVGVELGPKIAAIGKMFSPEERRGLMYVVATDMRDNIDTQFESQGAHFLGRRWQHLSERRLAERKAKDPAGPWPILQDTGNLRRSWETVATSERATVGTAGVSYASPHEFGQDRLPQRKILPYDALAREIAVTSAEVYVELMVGKLPK